MIRTNSYSFSNNNQGNK